MTDTPIIVFARLDSRRLPGKALLPLTGRPMLARVVARCVQATVAGPVVVATTDRPGDDPIAGLAAELGVAVFRGDAEDVAARALSCADAYAARQFVRISGDSPFIDAELIDMFVQRHRTTGAALTTNLHPRSFVPGMSIEIIDTAAMHAVLAASSDPHDREHVTPALYRTLPPRRILNVASDVTPPAGLSLAVDTADDLSFCAAILSVLGPRADSAGYGEILDAASALAAQQVAQ
ncbi:MAG: hypothetical protein FJX53_01045 [Alphaproteobacteria bacterium]|nr:hypothetical protein [Alphaproteobacteria bacterium]